MKKKNNKRGKNKKKYLLQGFLYGGVIFVFFCIFFSIMCDKLHFNETEIKEDIGVLYQRDLLMKAKENTVKYEINDNSNVVVDASTLVNDRKYRKCSGKVTINRQGDKYEYFPEVNCGDNTTKLQLKSLGELTTDVYYIDNDFMISSYKNVEIIDRKLISGDLILSFYDGDGKLRWLDEVDISDDVNNSYLSVIGVNKIGDYYYVVCNRPIYSMEDNSYTDSSVYYLKYNLDGNLIETKEANINGYKPTIVKEFVGDSNDSYFYSGYIKLDGDEDFSKCLIYLDKEGFHIFKENEIREMSKYFDIRVAIDNEYIYGIYNDDSRESIGEDEFPLSIYKININTGIINKKPFYYEKGNFSTEYVTMVTDDAIYYLYGEDDNTSKKHVFKYDKYLNYIKEINLNDYIKSNNQYIFNYLTASERINYLYYDDDGEYAAEVDYNDNYIGTRKLLTEKVFNNYYVTSGMFYDKKIILSFVDNEGNIILSFQNS